MNRTRIGITLAALVCVACAREVTVPQDDATPDAPIRHGGGTLGSGYRTPADSMESGSVTGILSGGGTLGSGYATPGADTGTLGSGY